jgi:p-methyltransferase
MTERLDCLVVDGRRLPYTDITGQGYRWRHSTMDIHDAGDALDRISAEVTGSVCIPTYNFDFWALPYPFGKGSTLEQVTTLLRLARRSMRFNADPRTPAARAAEQALEGSFDGVLPRPSKYRTRPGTAVSSPSRSAG